MDGKKALIGMSGGVDSSVAALLMLRAGYECIGATMRLYDNDMIGLEKGHTCCSPGRRGGRPQRGQPSGNSPLRVQLQGRLSSGRSSGNLSAAYECGGTPNPCIDCNRYLKFDRLLRRALELGCDCVVSGHYAQVTEVRRPIPII